MVRVGHHQIISASDEAADILGAELYAVRSAPVEEVRRRTTAYDQIDAAIARAIATDVRAAWIERCGERTTDRCTWLRQCDGAIQRAAVGIGDGHCVITRDKSAEVGDVVRCESVRAGPHDVERARSAGQVHLDHPGAVASARNVEVAVVAHVEVEHVRLRCCDGGALLRCATVGIGDVRQVKATCQAGDVLVRTAISAWSVPCDGVGGHSTVQGQVNRTVVEAVAHIAGDGHAGNEHWCLFQLEIRLQLAAVHIGDGYGVVARGETVQVFIQRCETVVRGPVEDVRAHSAAHVQIDRAIVAVATDLVTVAGVAHRCRHIDGYRFGERDARALHASSGVGHKQIVRTHRHTDQVLCRAGEPVRAGPLVSPWNGTTQHRSVDVAHGAVAAYGVTAAELGDVEVDDDGHRTGERYTARCGACVRIGNGHIVCARFKPADILVVAGETVRACPADEVDERSAAQGQVYAAITLAHAAHVTAAGEEARSNLHVDRRRLGERNEGRGTAADGIHYTDRVSTGRQPGEILVDGYETVRSVPINGVRRDTAHDDGIDAAVASVRAGHVAAVGELRCGQSDVDRGGRRQRPALQVGAAVTVGQC